MSYEQKYLKYKQKYIDLFTKQIGGKKKKIIIDTDPGIDDALAILLALGNDQVEVLALTTVFGNFPNVRILTDNALKILNLAERRDIPVYEGASSPLVIPKNLNDYICTTMSAQSVKVHGDNGLANMELPLDGLTKQSEFAATAIIRLAKANPKQITLITLGPLTNLALALMMCPELPTLLDSVIIMGGALFSPRHNPVNSSDANLGNAATAAEANFFKDPFSAQKVLNAGFPKEKIFLVPLDLTTLTNYRDFGLSLDKKGKIETMPKDLQDGKITKFIATSHHFYTDVYVNKFKRGKVPFHDACAVFMAISPCSFTTKLINVRVETKGEFTFGMTVIDHRPHLFPPNITFCDTIKCEELNKAIIVSINKLQANISKSAIFSSPHTHAKNLQQHYINFETRIPVNKIIIIPNKTSEGLGVFIKSSDPEVADVTSWSANDFYYLETKKVGNTKLRITNSGFGDYTSFYEKKNIEVYYEPLFNTDSHSGFSGLSEIKTVTALSLPLKDLIPHIMQILSRVFFCEFSTYKSDVYYEYIQKTWQQMGFSGQVEKEQFLSNLTVNHLHEAFTVVKKAFHEKQFYHHDLWLLNHDIINPINTAINWLNFMGKLAKENNTFSKMYKKLRTEYGSNNFIPVQIKLINGKVEKERESNYIITEEE